MNLNLNDVELFHQIYFQPTTKVMRNIYPHMLSMKIIIDESVYDFIQAINRGSAHMYDHSIHLLAKCLHFMLM